MRKLKNLYISSIHQNAGKTTVSLGMYKVFRERKLRPAFMKPIGQQTVAVNKQDIDKDSLLIEQVYHCRTKLKDMSPVTIGQGFTEQYIFRPEPEILRNRIQQSFQRLTKGKDSIIIEGTGHAGVGSVIDLSNADVAKLLGSKVVIVTGGGIGRSIDEVMLNKGLFDLMNLQIVGVIVNKVLPEKYEKIKRVLSQGLKNKGIPLLGVIPMDPLLSAPTVAQIMSQLKLEVLCGQRSLNRRVKNTIVAAMEPYNMINYLESGTLVLTSGDRVDNIMVAVSSHLVKLRQETRVAGIILSGGLVPNTKIMDLLRKSQIPILLSQEDTYTVAGKIEHLICKIQKADKDKILEARHLVERYVDVDALIRSL